MSTKTGAGPTESFCFTFLAAVEAAYQQRAAAVLRSARSVVVSDCTGTVHPKQLKPQLPVGTQREGQSEGELA